MSSGGHARSEEDLRHWLAEEDWYMSRHTREWLERTPPEEAADTLARIAGDAAPEPRAAGPGCLLALASAGFSMSGAIAGQGPRDRKAGIRAALMLAQQNDARGVPPLVRVYETDPRRQNKYHELIEGALTRFLSGPIHVHEAAGHDASLVRDLAERIWQSGGGRRDLTAESAALLLAALRRLHAPGGGPEAAALDEAITASDADAKATPNRARVQAARALPGA